MKWLSLFVCILIANPVWAQSPAPRQYPQPAGEATPETNGDDNAAATSPPTTEPVSDSEPILLVELPEGEILVGQALVLSVKILVPTYMPKPPAYPNLEVPNLLVRLPERSTSPVSERIDGESWSGTQRRYRIYPLAPGAYEVPLTAIAVTYADPETNAPVETVLEPETVIFTATMPDGAENLSPPIVATAFTLEQEIEGEVNLASGAPFTRRLTARIEGTTPILIPVLTPEISDPAIRGYPKEPKITETENRGNLSGERIEETVYLGQSGGPVTLPAVSIDWFNLTTNALETAKAEAIDLMVESPPPPPPSPAQILRWGLGAVFGLFVLWVAYDRLRQPLQSIASTLRYRWQNSEAYSARKVRAAIKSRSLANTYATVDDWRTQFGSSIWETAEQQALDECLSALGQSRLGRSAGTGSDGWAQVLSTFEAVRKQSRKPMTDAKLPPLNPSRLSSGKT